MVWLGLESWSDTPHWAGGQSHGLAWVRVMVRLSLLKRRAIWDFISQMVLFNITGPKLSRPLLLWDCSSHIHHPRLQNTQQCVQQDLFLLGYHLPVYHFRKSSKDKSIYSASCLQVANLAKTIPVLLRATGDPRSNTSSKILFLVHCQANLTL